MQWNFVYKSVEATIKRYNFMMWCIFCSSSTMNSLVSSIWKCTSLHHFHVAIVKWTNIHPSEMVQCCYTNCKLTNNAMQLATGCSTPLAISRESDWVGALLHSCGAITLSPESMTTCTTQIPPYWSPIPTVPASPLKATRITLDCGKNQQNTRING